MQKLKKKKKRTFSFKKDAIKFKNKEEWQEI